MYLSFPSLFLPIIGHIIFKIALESALAQTYSNIEIIVGDDSTNNETEKINIQRLFT